MTPLLYLRDEFNSVLNTLDETLRHDYGAKDADQYYGECEHRLQAVRRRMEMFTDERDPRIADQLAALGNIANRVALIERSHLGEFSWPFAEVIRQIADVMLTERSLKKRSVRSLPIVHMIAEGTGYNIRNEKNPDLTRRRRIVIVAFPRQLRHHVLMHAIFGHELGHAAFHTNVAGRICKGEVLPLLRREGPLHDEQTLKDWILSPKAPEPVQEHLRHVENFRISKGQVELWSLELMCDLFGLLIFGAAFVSAHRTLLEPTTRSTFDIELRSPTHPPLAVRRRVLVDAMKVLGLDEPTTAEEDGPVHEAEKLMLKYALETSDDPWPALFTQDQLKAALEAMLKVFETDPSVMSRRPSGKTTRRLVDRLARRLPPILEQVDERGVAKQQPMTASECLYAGWVYWFGRHLLASEGVQVDFLKTNRLCDHALMQQRAIDLRLEAEAGVAKAAETAAAA